MPKQTAMHPKSTVVYESNMKRLNIKQLVLPGSQDTICENENESMRVKTQFCQGIIGRDRAVPAAL